MEAFSNPYLLVLMLILSTISTKFLWKGFKDKHISSWLYGIGTGIPTFAMTNYKTWVVGVLFCVGGYYIKNNYDL